MEEKIYTVYCHINKANHKMYVGITKHTVEERWKRGKGYKTQVKFYRAIQKYGWDGFEHIIVASNLSQDEAFNLERILIKENHTQNKRYGYNVTAGGDANPATSIEVRKKISASMQGKYVGENNHWYGKHHTNETKDKISKAKTGKYAGEKSPWYGKRHTEESKKKMSDARKGKYIGEESPMYGKHHSEATKKKIRNKTLEQFRTKGHPRDTMVICLNTMKIYSNIQDAGKSMNTWPQHIGKCCKGKAKSAGKHPITNEPLHWMYYEDYLAQQGQLDK